MNNGKSREGIIWIFYQRIPIRSNTKEEKVSKNQYNHALAKAQKIQKLLPPLCSFLGILCTKTSREIYFWAPNELPFMHKYEFAKARE